MAKIWFARREGGRWVVPGGQPAFECPLESIVFKLDLGPQRFLRDTELFTRIDVPTPAPEDLTKAIVETTVDDLNEQKFTLYRQGYYDSPYSPREVARRLAPS